ncbi:protocatechuate 3,4-dioxygenase subunit alpha [Streptomyces sp. HNM0574]|uniref:protocatechuate 3,4-dioxygenase subunit alpha n=1 Tax=Streptomyces sp. HNM0574 TaxID=2714954 RepID=UPI00146C1DC3|nr:protocatechuate 3,4-dioxygenase subunit alpha [Streptomyces sp. HNM0574]NLU69195.1 protocatechuate 3,4-dioxygenase subunit alpha [Streptomyces sp. HNM0574]
MTSLPPTPSHTVGPFYGYALPFPGGGEPAPPCHPDTVTVHGYVYDGAGEPVPDALLELWQAGPEGEIPGAPGSLRRDPATGRHPGRDGVEFTGFGRVATGADGHWAFRTLVPGARGGHAPYLSLCLFARGLLHHLFTRVYLPDLPGQGSAQAEAQTRDPLLASLDEERRGTLVAAAEPRTGTFRFDIRIQGEKETVFLDFH